MIKERKSMKWNIGFSLAIAMLFFALVPLAFSQEADSSGRGEASESIPAEQQEMEEGSDFIPESQQEMEEVSAFRFVVIGDMHIGCDGLTDIEKKALEKIVREVKPSFVIQLGSIVDVRNTGEKSKEECIKKMWSAAKKDIIDLITGNGMLFFPTPGATDGNMGKNSVGKKLFSEFWSAHAESNRNYPISGEGYGKYYSFDFGDSHFISLVAPGTKGLIDKKQQLGWLKEDIAEAKAAGLRNIFTFSGSPLNSPATTNPSKKKTSYLQSSRELMAILKANGIKMHFGGNIHILKEDNIEGIRDIKPGVLGGGKSGLASTGKSSDYSFVVIDVDGNEMQYYVVKEPDFDASELPPAPTVSSSLSMPDVPDSLSGLGVCPAGMVPSTSSVGILPVVACGDASIIPPPSVITGDVVLQYAHRYQGRPYGSSDPCGFVCTSFVSRVLNDLGVKVDKLVVSVSGAGKYPGKTASDLVSEDIPIHRGVQKAIVDAGVGKEVSIDEAQPGDFVQYWYKNKEIWAGHAVIIESVKENGYFNVYGAHADKGVGILRNVHLSAMKAYAARLNPDAGSGASSSSPAGFTQSLKAGSVHCVVDTSVLKMIYDIIINSSMGKTTVTGIARQNLAVGITKAVQPLAEGAFCSPIASTQDYDLEYLKQTYGRSKLDVEAQLQTVNFLGHDVKVHKLIAPVLGCVNKDIDSCIEGKNYGYRIVEGFKWQAPAENPELLATSSFGISININPDTNMNAQNNELITDLPGCVVAAFKKYGFKWGGDYETVKAPAHFEYMADPRAVRILGAPIGQGMSSTAGLFCNYCNVAKEILKSFDPQAYSTCVKSRAYCCKAPCPPDSAIKHNTPFMGQCSYQPQVETENCWKINYCGNACSSLTTAMAFKSMGFDVPLNQIFCPQGEYTSMGPDARGAVTGSTGAIYKSAKKAGFKNAKIVSLPDGQASSSDLDTMATYVSQGNVLAFILSDTRSCPCCSAKKATKKTPAVPATPEYTACRNERAKLNERQFMTGGHFILIHGVGNDYFIANDPYDPSGLTRGGKMVPENLVLSRDYIGRVGRAYVVIG